jgi:hypothetical protein
MLSERSESEKINFLGGLASNFLSSFRKPATEILQVLWEVCCEYCLIQGKWHHRFIESLELLEENPNCVRPLTLQNESSGRHLQETVWENHWMLQTIAVKINYFRW